MRKIGVEERRASLVRRHRLAGDARDPESVARDLVALHATDPASVYLSVLVRSLETTLADVSAAMYERRSLIRWLAMRRTLFLFPRDDVPMIQAAVSTQLAATLRRALITRLERNGTEPTIEGDVGPWLARLERKVARVIDRRGSATGAELVRDVPALGVSILPRVSSDRPQRLTSSLLTVMSADGRIVRGSPTGPWTSRQHRWEPVSAWWPEGLAPPHPDVAREELVRRYLESFGPATLDDIVWWTGWNKTTTRRALAGVGVEEVDLHGREGLDLADADRSDDDRAPRPVASLLPALDPSPMGWKHRDWFLGVDPKQLFDRAGNIGPTIWWRGEVVGSWALTTDGELRTAVVVDRGQEAARAIERAAADLHGRLDGARFTPAARTPLERSLSDDLAPRPKQRPR